MWETLSGSIFLRFAHPGFYSRLLEENKDRITTSTEDIEKDLHRSLPEYAGYQSEDGIGALRRVLRAYSFRNSEVGYCQAMNILAAAVLMWVSPIPVCSTIIDDSLAVTCRKNKPSGC